MNPSIRGVAFALATAVLLLLAGCVSPGGYVGYPGGGSGYPEQGYPQDYGNRIVGTVDGLDRGYGRILLVIEDPRSGRSQRMEVGYDRTTRLFYQGREHAVEGLERGDVVSIEVVQSGRELWARSIEVVHNVRDGGYGGHGPDDQLRGSVAWVDTRARLLHLDAGHRGGGTEVAYDGRTTVEYQGRRYRPEDLERGDQVRIQARRTGSRHWLAERIIVERSVR